MAVEMRRLTLEVRGEWDALHLILEALHAFQPRNEKTVSVQQRDRQGFGSSGMVRIYFPGGKTPQQLNKTSPLYTT